jgi:Trm5-related predicted tRNA methylase
MNREVRPVEALEQFSASESRSIREIAIKALKDRYGILQSDKLNAEMVSLTSKMVEINQSVANSTKLTFWATFATAVIALIALCVSCSTNK